jgi:hypothetical protein
MGGARLRQGWSGMPIPNTVVPGSPRPVTARRPVAALCVAWLLLVGVGHPVAQLAAGEYDLKAAFLLNFGRFVEWPSSAFASGTSPFVIGIAGEDPLGARIDEVVAGRTIGGRTVQVLRLNDLDEATRCHIVFVSKALPPGRVAQLLGRLKGRSVLTVGESSGFPHRGGVINFTLEDGTVRFEVSQSNAERSQLKVSSKLLGLAHLVKEEDAPPASSAATPHRAYAIPN